MLRQLSQWQIRHAKSAPIERPTERLIESEIAERALSVIPEEALAHTADSRLTAKSMSQFESQTDTLELLQSANAANVP